jgi:hypothetical protein
MRLDAAWRVISKCIIVPTVICSLFESRSTEYQQEGESSTFETESPVALHLNHL